MNEDTTKPLSNVIRIDEGEKWGHLHEMVRGTVWKGLNSLLDAQAEQMCRAHFRQPRANTEGGGPATAGKGQQL